MQFCAPSDKNKAPRGRAYIQIQKEKNYLTPTCYLKDYLHVLLVI